MKPKHIKSLQTTSRELTCRMLDKHTIVVTSASNPNGHHVVTVHFDESNHVHARCTCEWARHRGVGCSHVMAALEHMANLKKRTLSFWTNEDDARRQKHRRFFLVGGGNEKQGIWITSRAA